MSLVFTAIVAPISGHSLNPARSLAALPSGQWMAIWIHLLAPPLGMLAAAAVNRWVLRATPICARSYGTSQARAASIAASLHRREIGVRGCLPRGRIVEQRDVARWRADLALFAVNKRRIVSCCTALSFRLSQTTAHAHSITRRTTKSWWMMAPIFLFPS